MGSYFKKEGEYLVMQNDSHFETLTAPLLGRTPEFKLFAEKESERFCRAVRAMVSGLSKGKPLPTKQVGCKTTGLVSRVYNFALDTSRAMWGSAEECLAANKEMLETKLKGAQEALSDIRSQLMSKELEWRWKAGPDGKPFSEKRAVQRLEAMNKLRHKRDNQARRVSRLQERLGLCPAKPSVFVFGKRSFYSQPGFNASPEERTAWRQVYREERNCLFGARGSSDERGGNSTYQVKYVGDKYKTSQFLSKMAVSTVLKFEVHAAGKPVGHFFLKERSGRQLQVILEANYEKFAFAKVDGKKLDEDGKPLPVNRKVTAGRTPVKVFFMRKGNAWNIYVSFPLEGAPKPQIVQGVIGVDTNHGHFDSYEVGNAGGEIAFGEYRHNPYDINANSQVKKQAISALIRSLTFRAKELNYAICLEKLDFEFAKKTLRTKLGATLHTMPYKAIVAKFRRECHRNGVPLRFISPQYTSLLGNLLATENPRLSRDVAAAGVIALRGLDGGNHFIQKLLGRYANPGSYRIRLNEKKRFGRHIEVVGVALCQSDNNVPCSAEEFKSSQRYAGVVIKNIAKAIPKRLYRLRGRLRCRAGSDDTGVPNSQSKPNLIVERRRSKTHRSNVGVLNFAQVL